MEIKKIDLEAIQCVLEDVENWLGEYRLGMYIEEVFTPPEVPDMLYKDVQYVRGIVDRRLVANR